MIYVLIRFKQACKDFLLPNQEIWHGLLTLFQTETGLNTDISIPMRCMEGQWYVDLPKGYRWQDEAAAAGERCVAEDSRFYMLSQECTLSLFFTRMEPAGLCLRKYVLQQNASVTIGRNPENIIRYDSPLVSGQHCMIMFDGNRCLFTDYSRNASFLNRQQVHQNSLALNVGDELFLAPGLKIICLGNRIAVNSPPGLAQVSLAPWARPPLGEACKQPESMRATVEYHRAPRLLERPDSEPVTIEPPIAKSDDSSMPLILTLGPSMTMIVPMLMGSMLAAGSGYMAAGLAMIGTSSALAVCWGMGNYRYRKNQAERLEAKRQRLYRSYIAQTEKQLAALYQKEQQRLLRTYPSTEECSRMGDGRSGRLWERMPTHADFMCVRFGLGVSQLPNSLNIPKPQLSLIDDPMRDEPARLNALYGVVRDVPITISLRTEPIIGVFGMASIQSILTAMVVQLAALHSYHDVKIVVLCDEANESQWMWARWLPHVYPSEDRNIRMVVSRPQARREVLSYLEEVIQMRRESERDASVQTKQDEKPEDPNQELDTLSLPIPHYVVISLIPELLENEPVMSHLLSYTPGFTLVCAARQMELLPKECRVIISAEKSYMGVFTTTGDITQVRFDTASIAACMGFAKELARVRVHDMAAGAAIPSIVSFLEIYHVRDVMELDIWRFWNENHAYEGLESIIGFRAGGKPFSLDISDKKHGPHGLVAGTTGSGKSVMLQTYILSLAMKYHPSQVQFILIDYKGGGMADAFVGLPHVAGTIDNLQGIRAIQRALASIKGEINRREAIFKSVGVFSIDEYMRTFHDQPDHEPLSHLIIVVDEFAELKKEQPEFMRELISASRVGRSVGVHLILATQKPSNSVDDEIWSNARFRICLRVQGRTDSMDMLKRPDAAYIKGMGRCYVQIGNDEIFEEVQTSWSGAAYRPHDSATLEKPHLLNDAGQPVRTVRRAIIKTKVDEATQMSAVLERIQNIVREHAVQPAKRLWLDVLPLSLSLNAIPAYASCAWNGTWNQRPSDELKAIVGLADDLLNQRHMPVEINFTQSRNHLFIGLASSGKTTLLQTLAMSLCTCYTPDQLHIYAFSLSSRTLGVLHALPHVGDIVYEDEPYETLRMLLFLNEENERRHKLFAIASTDNFVAYQRSTAANPKLETVPAIVVLLDRVAQLEEVLNEEQKQIFYQLLREGNSRGIYFAATAMAMDEVYHKVRDCFRTVTLQLHQRSDYSDVLGVRLPSDMADVMQTSGRGVVLIGGMAYEWQAALFGNAQTDTGRAMAIAEFSARMRETWRGPLTQSLPRIPKNLSWTVLDHDARKTNLMGPLRLPVGYLSIEGTPAIADIYKQFVWLVLGNRGCGRTTCLQGIAACMKMRGAEIYIFGGAEWNTTAAKLGAKLYLPEIYQTTDFNDILLNEMQKRTRLRKEIDPADEQANREFAAQLTPFVILMDNLDEVVSKINNELLMMLQSACNKGGGFGLYLFASLSMSKVAQVKTDRLFRAMAEMQAGIVLGSKLADIDVWDFSNLSYAYKKNVPPIGEGYLVERLSTQRIVVPKE